MRSHPRSTRIALAVMYGTARQLRPAIPARDANGKRSVTVQDHILMLQQANIMHSIRKALKVLAEDGNNPPGNDPLAAVMNSTRIVEGDTLVYVMREMTDRRNRLLAAIDREHAREEWERTWRRRVENAHMFNPLDPHLQSDEEAKHEIVLDRLIQRAGKTHFELKVAFMRIAPHPDWKAPIHAVMPADTTSDQIGMFSEACIYFTGQPLETTRTPEGVLLTSMGYRASMED